MFFFQIQIDSFLYCSIIEQSSVFINYLQYKINIYTVQKLNKKNNMQNDQDHFNVLRKIDNSNKFTQRLLATKLGFSLGKLNYCLKYLKQHGLIKISRFGKSKNKLKYMYILTPRGLKARTRLTINYMKLKMKEYDQLKKELKK